MSDSQPTTASGWTQLFAGDAGAGRPVSFRILRKHGEPLLSLPLDNRCAAQALALYPAQSWRARVARRVARTLISIGLTPARERVEVDIAPTAPLARFLCERAGTAELPAFAVLNGNPRTPGRRFVILVFDTKAQPVGVIKAGAGAAAMALIQSEAAFLKSLTAPRPGIPIVRGECSTPAVAAFAIDFAPGDSPRAGDDSLVSQTLSGWLHRERTVALSDLPTWRKLQQSAADDARFGVLANQLTSAPVCPTISHGDLAPWNIKVRADGSWLVLDWERGDLNGVPGWDWFHYVIQPEILVHRRLTGEIVRGVEALLAWEPFREYAKVARVTGREQALVQSYLLHMLHVIRPAQGRAATEELLNALTERWQKR